MMSDDHHPCPLEHFTMYIQLECLDFCAIKSQSYPVKLSHVQQLRRSMSVDETQIFMLGTLS